MNFKQALDSLIHLAALPMQRVNVDSEALRMLINDWGRLDKIVREQEARVFADMLVVQKRMLKPVCEKCKSELQMTPWGPDCTFCAEPNDPTDGF